MQARKASIKESGEELSTAEWQRFDEAVARLKAERRDDPEHDTSDERREAAERNGRAVA